MIFRNRHWLSAVMICILSTIAFADTKPVEPEEAVQKRLQKIISKILTAWDQADVVCLGEDHGSKNDSDLRIALIEHPDFVHKVHVIIVEFADTLHQDLLDRLVLEGENIPRDKLREVWKNTSGKEVWSSPIYEVFLRTVQRVNASLPRQKRVRLLAGDNSSETNRGKFIRDTISREILSKGLKALAIYGSVHCECRGMGFPGELKSQYPRKIWAISSFYDAGEGRRVFHLNDEPALIQVTGTENEKLPADKMFFLGRHNDTSTLGDLFDAIVYYGNIQDQKVPPQNP